MKKNEYSKQIVEFKQMSRKGQRAFIKKIIADSDLDYVQTWLTLSFFVRNSALSRFEKLRLLRRFHRPLKSKCVSYSRANNIVVKREKIFADHFLHRCYTVECSSVPDIRESYIPSQFFRRGTLRYLYRVL